MNKLSKIFLVIIILLTIALGIMTYYVFYWRSGYVEAVNELIRVIEENGLEGQAIIENE